MINCRNYKNFSNELFCVDLIKELSNNTIPEDYLIGSLDASKKSLEYHAPPKRKHIRENQEINFFVLDLKKVKKHIISNVTVVLSSLEMQKNLIIAILT